MKRLLLIPLLAFATLAQRNLYTDRFDYFGTEMSFGAGGTVTSPTRTKNTAKAITFNGFTYASGTGLASFPFLYFTDDGTDRSLYLGKTSGGLTDFRIYGCSYAGTPALYFSISPSGTVTTYSTTVITGLLRPDADGTRDLGSTAYSWSNLWLDGNAKLGAAGNVEFQGRGIIESPSTTSIALRATGSGNLSRLHFGTSNSSGPALSFSGTTIQATDGVGGLVPFSANTIELGNASDTTLARSAAGVVTIEGLTVLGYSGTPAAGDVLVMTNSAWTPLPITSGLTMPSVELVDHFIQRQDGGTKFEGNIWPGGGGSGGSVVYQALADPGGRPGIARLNTVTTSTSYAYFTSAADGIRLGYGATEFECAIQLSALSDATDTYRFQAGFFDGYGTTSVTDGAFILYSHGVNSGKFQFVTSSNSTQSTGDTGVTVAAATWYRLKVVVNAAGTSATATIMNGSGTSLGTATLTSNIPTGSGRQCGSGTQMVRSAGTATRYSDVDWHRLKLQPAP